ncbi:hypothetical protein Selin_1513 [Desulfurispirillum indicum S5]|uniref:Uncharacterized protein n=1 Tax=Desulfurispirillum indicum (strain ATCC BAA-1389 / DSM 22839 / S5) TaxID=653733 RepID=E6W779_DESIS|nr:hypothetical protein Selin_1513 [Desulfurispirillum indicum S5]
MRSPVPGKRAAEKDSTGGRFCATLGGSKVAKKLIDKARAMSRNAVCAEPFWPSQYGIQVGADNLPLRGAKLQFEVFEYKKDNSLSQIRWERREDDSQIHCPHGVFAAFPASRVSAVNGRETDFTLLDLYSFACIRGQISP